MTTYWKPKQWRGPRFYI